MRSFWSLWNKFRTSVLLLTKRAYNVLLQFYSANYLSRNLVKINVAVGDVWSSNVVKAIGKYNIYLIVYVNSKRTETNFCDFFNMCKNFKQRHPTSQTVRVLINFKKKIILKCYLRNSEMNANRKSLVFYSKNNPFCLEMSE